MEYRSRVINARCTIEPLSGFHAYSGAWFQNEVPVSLGVGLMAYQLEGKLLEVCDCNVLCPCWIGEDADNGTCDAVVAYHIDKGTVDGTDVSGLTLALLHTFRATFCRVTGA